MRGPPECVAPRGREMLLLIECSVCGRQACDGHAEGRAAHVVQTCVVAELHRRRFAAVLAADTAFEVFAGSAALEYGFADQLAHAVAVEDLERVVFQDALLQSCISCPDRTALWRNPLRDTQKRRVVVSRCTALRRAGRKRCIQPRAPVSKKQPDPK